MSETEKKSRKGSRKVKAGFQSQAQFKKCWTLHNESIKKGEKPKWDCRKIAHEGKPFKELPKYVTHRCNAITKRGTKCKNKVVEKSKKCYLH